MAGARNDILLTDAFEYAAHHHRKQTRKGGDIPYLAHVLGVASLVLEYGGTDRQAAAALLHDVAEDHGGETRLEEIKKKFGKRVARIVRECSDSLAADPAKKEKWSKRKKRYVKHLRTTAHNDALLVSCADKLYNARATLGDARDIGPKVWKRFHAGPKKQAANYRALSNVFSARLRKGRGAALARELRAVVNELEIEAAKAR
jgi:(p)ppGpp synthase/HD superfamily hydrolase